MTVLEDVTMILVILNQLILLIKEKMVFVILTLKKKKTSAAKRFSRFYHTFIYNYINQLINNSKNTNKVFWNLDDIKLKDSGCINQTKNYYLILKTLSYMKLKIWYWEQVEMNN